jgi:hypothetical protein
MLAILAPLVSWIFRGVVIKFVIFTGLFAVMALLIPRIISWILPFITPASLTSAFSSISPAMWWFIDMFQLDVGLPLLISAVVTRFLIRRLPVIG